MKNETTAYLILLSLATLSTQYAFVTVYFDSLHEVEYGFIFLLMATVMRAVLAPTVLSVFKRLIR